MLTLIKQLRSAKKFARDDSGATAIEYGVIAALIAVVVIGVLVTLGPQLANQFTAIQNSLPAAPQ